ncbi:MAG: SIMPL domain-containing protein [Thermoleophilia bacterium]
MRRPTLALALVPALVAAAALAGCTGSEASQTAVESQPAPTEPASVPVEPAPAEGAPAPGEEPSAGEPAPAEPVPTGTDAAIAGPPLDAPVASPPSDGVVPGTAPDVPAASPPLGADSRSSAVPPVRPGTVAAASTPGITVTSSGQVEVVPDVARVTLGVDARADVAGDALAEASTRLTAVLDAVRALGVAGEDVQTQQASVQPVTAEDGSISGYVASNVVTITVRQLDRAGELIDGAVRAGANQVQSISLGLADDADARARALEAAIAGARAKAEGLAARAGVTLGELVDVTETSDGSGPAPLPIARAADVPVELGTVPVVASVAVTFAIAG